MEGPVELDLDRPPGRVDVPEQGQAVTHPKDPVDLRQGGVGAEVMERMSDRHTIHGRIEKRNGLSRPVQNPCGRRRSGDLGSHRRRWLHRHDVESLGHQNPGEVPGTGAEIEDPRPGGEAGLLDQPVHGLRADSPAETARNHPR